MILEIEFAETNHEMEIEMGEVNNVSDGGYERGYSEGFANGLAERTYETWTITLTDGSIIEKEIALL